jgi:hypothetical protein
MQLFTIIAKGDKNDINIKINNFQILIIENKNDYDNYLYAKTV